MDVAAARAGALIDLSPARPMIHFCISILAAAQRPELGCQSREAQEAQEEHGNERWGLGRARVKVE